MFDKTLNQIKEYQKVATAKELTWTE